MEINTFAFLTPTDAYERLSDCVRAFPLNYMLIFDILRVNFITKLSLLDLKIILRRFDEGLNNE
jgi:hypothetical protein